MIRKILLFIILSLLQNYILSSIPINNQKEVLICNHERMIGEPTYLDIINSIISFDTINLHFDSYSQKIDSEMNAICDKFNIDKQYLLYPFVLFYELLNKTFTIKALVSNGQYYLSYGTAMNTYTFNDVFLIQRNGIVFNYFCKYMNYEDVFQSICQLNHNILGDDILFDGLDINEFTVKPSICTDKSVADGYCKVNVDSFTDSCLLIRLSNTNELTTNIDENTIRNSVTYQYIVPTLYGFYSNLMEQIGLKLTLHPNQSLNDMKTNRDIIHLIILKIFSFTPIYIFNFMVGWLILMNACDVSESKLGQTIIQIIAGFFLSLIVILYICYWMYR